MSDHDLCALFDAARSAPSNGNRQPWRFIVRAAPEMRDAMASALTRGNQWALAAPVLAVLVTRAADGRISNGIPYAYFDCGLAAMCLVIEAESRGLRAHQMAGFNREALGQLLRLPGDVEPLVVIAIGYEGDPAALPADLQEKERRSRERKPASEVWTTDVWNPEWTAAGSG